MDGGTTRRRDHGPEQKWLNRQTYLTFFAQVEKARGTSSRLLDLQMTQMPVPTGTGGASPLEVTVKSLIATIRLPALIETPTVVG